LILSSSTPKQQTPLKSQSISFLSPWGTTFFFFSPFLTILFPVSEGKRRFAAYFLFFYPSFAFLGTLSASASPAQTVAPPRAAGPALFLLFTSHE
jgi:hypothetical protein